MWWDPQDEHRIILGSDGGVSISVDGGKTADYFPNMGIGEVYAVAVDMDDPYHVYGGMQDHDSWKGPSNGRDRQHHARGLGHGRSRRRHVQHRRSDEQPLGLQHARAEPDGPDGPEDRRSARNIAPPQPAGGPRLRYNWIAPIAMSPFNPEIVYAGAQVLFRSLDRGDHWEAISPDLTTNDPAKIGRNVPFCTITTISESPVTAGIIWVGTDDGKVQLTRNHGGDVDRHHAGARVGRRAGGPMGQPRVRLAARRRHRIRVEERFPERRLLAVSLPDDRLRKDVDVHLDRSPECADQRRRAGSETRGSAVRWERSSACSCRSTAAAHWTQMKANLPTIPVQDLTIHPRENDLVLGTYGRAFWVGDITPLQELSADVLDENVHLFDIEPRARYGFSDQGMNYHLFGDKYLEVPNEPETLVVNYYLKGDAAGDAKITVADLHGKTVRELTGPAKEGLNQALVPLAGSRGRGRGRSEPAVAPLEIGDYMVTVEVAGETLTKPAHVRARLTAER